MIGSHQSAKMLNDEWLTPPNIIESLGKFDLDPCAPINRPWDTAVKHYTIKENGLWQQWHGRVWLNPPYGRQTKLWLQKMVAHNNGITLMFARTETNMFFSYVWDKCSALLFLKGRIHFHHIDGSQARANSGAPSVLLAYGSENAEKLRLSGISGKFIYNKGE